MVESPVHGDIEEWNPQAPAALPAGAPALNVTVRTIEPVSSISPPPPELAAGESRRAFGLDALRGLFLISMTLGFTLGSNHLPLWMYHRQFPFGTETPVDQPGISWRDLAYASFLFTMAAALPLTLSRRIEKGAVEIDIITASLRRYGLLLVYALLIGHSNTFFLGYTQPARILSIVGFGLMAMIFTRRRPDWDPKKFAMINRAGWALAVVFLALTPLTYGKQFSFDRIDDIIAGLAFASLFGSLIWYFTRTNLTARLAVLGVCLAAFLGAKGDGWVSQWWWDSPFSWAFSPSRFVLMATVIPGTIVGDLILRWMRSSSDQVAPSWSSARLGGLIALAVAFTPVITVAMYNRQVQLGTLLAMGMLAGGFFLVADPQTATERLLRSLFLWATCWMLIGLFVEPFDGGIRKVPDNLSYYFTVTGTTSMLLVALVAIVDGLKRQRWVATLVDVGHNPLLCYVLFTVFLNPLSELVPAVRDMSLDNMAVQATRSIIELSLVIAAVRWMSRRRIYWRT
ncbi:MAG TPA: DUF5009 domain-containing protein [Gemmatimonadaceae bacterium]